MALIGVMPLVVVIGMSSMFCTDMEDMAIVSYVFHSFLFGITGREI